MSLVTNPQNIRLGVAGRVPQDDHPFSWSAILNGFDRDAMEAFAVPMIARYLSAQPTENFGIPGVSVTHIWCDDPDEAVKISRAARIGTIVTDVADLCETVDAVLIPTDRPEEHVERARPFVDANIPIFIDKPLCDQMADLDQFQRWIDAGAAILSSSAMRYAVEFHALRQNLKDIGELRFVQVFLAKSWRRYGMHALEALYPFFEPGGWKSALNSGENDQNIVHFAHRSGPSAVVCMAEDSLGGFGSINVVGTEGQLAAKFSDSFTAFKRQLFAFVEYLRTGIRPFPFQETRELTEMLIAAAQSHTMTGRRIPFPLS